MISITTFIYDKCPNLVAVQVGPNRWHVFHRSTIHHVVVVSHQMVQSTEHRFTLAVHNEIDQLNSFVELLKMVIAE